MTSTRLAHEQLTSFDRGEPGGEVRSIVRQLDVLLVVKRGSEESEWGKREKTEEREGETNVGSKVIIETVEAMVQRSIGLTSTGFM